MRKDQLMKRRQEIFCRVDRAVNRRRFLLTGGAAAAGLAGSGPAAAARSGKMRLRVVYALHAVKQHTADWPNRGFDFAPVMERINAALAQAFPDYEFRPATASGPIQAGKIILGDVASGIDGYIVVQMNNWNLVVQPIAATGKPVLFVPFLYGGTGEFLFFNSRFLRQNRSQVGFVSSSNLDDLIAAVKCFERVKPTGAAADFAAAVAQVRRERTPGPGDLAGLADPLSALSPEETLRKMRESKILAVGYPGVSLRGLPIIPMRMLSLGKLNAAWKAADRDQAAAIAEGWRQSAAAVEGVSEETLANSAAMYLGMKKLLQENGANAITINCLVGFYRGFIHAYPCLGFHELCNEGLVGACECDVRSTATMLAINAMTRGRPGYISDPVLDTATRRIIYAHCVASNRPFGPQGPANPFQILTHSEDRQGASVRSILPSGYMTSTLEFASGRKQILFHQAKTLANDPDDRACRTKLVAEPVGDIEKLFTQWDQWGWHRVTVYGDLKEPVLALADAMGYELVPEA
jgi:hypothetical protein